VVASAPHAQILGEAALVVSHCGHGTTIKTLAAGVPMVCIPMGRDQNDTAVRVVHHGAGVRLSPKASVAAIRGAVTKVLGDDHFRAKAQRLAQSIADDGLRSDVVDDLESMARS
jgi:UDP:flavonoid glycosyltransferase YjiC (YdhE family)